MGKDRRALIDFVTKFKSLLETLLDAAVWISLLIIVGVLIYVLTGVFGGSIFRMQPAEVNRVDGAMDLLTTWFIYACGVAAFLPTIRAKENKAEIGGGVLLCGALFWFGFPVLVGYLMNVKGGTGNAVVDIAVRNIVTAGKVMLVAMVWPVVEFVWRALRSVPLKQMQEDLVAKSRLKREAPKAAKPKTKPHFLSPCWHLPYCRDYLVNMCPAFKAKRRCWKFGGGCFCDQSMIEAMLTGMSRGPQQRGQQAYFKSEIAARTGVARQRAGKPPCKKCFIYLEHERLKYDVMHPLAYPAAVAIVYFGYPYIKQFWIWGQTTLTNIWTQLAYQQVTTPEALLEMKGMEAVTVMFAILCGMFLLIGLLRFCELWCFKWKL